MIGRSCQDSQLCSLVVICRPACLIDKLISLWTTEIQSSHQRKIHLTNSNIHNSLPETIPLGLIPDIPIQMIHCPWRPYIYMNCCFMITCRLAGRQSIGLTVFSCDYRKVTLLMYIQWQLQNHLCVYHLILQGCSVVVYILWLYSYGEVSFSEVLIQQLHLKQAVQPWWQQMLLIPQRHSNLLQPEEVTV